MLKAIPKCSVISRSNALWAVAELPGLANDALQREIITLRTMHEYLYTHSGLLSGFAANAPERFHSLSGKPSPKTSIGGLSLAANYRHDSGFKNAMAARGAAAKAALQEAVQPDLQ